MSSDPAGWVLAVLLGGVLALDATSVGQFMLSRPLVACTLAGVLAGDPAAGALIGAVLEALHLAVLPVGAARYPESAPAGVAAGAVFAWSGGGGAALLALSLMAVVWEHVGSLTVSWLRGWNARRLEAAPLSAAQVARLHLTGVAVDGARGMLVTAGGLAAAMAALAVVRELQPDPAIAQGGVLLAAGAAAASAVRLFGMRRLPWFAAGAVLAAVTLWAG